MMHMEAELKQLLVDDNHPFFNVKGMKYKEFFSDYLLVRFYAAYITQDAPESLKEGNLLEQQVSEVIKNAIKHGNKMDKNKRVKVWYEFTPKRARIIVEDEGEGFKDLEKWNEFYRKRMEAIEKGDMEEILRYATFRTERSSEEDGGNSLFAAIEYWNKGIVYNSKKNKVACVREIEE